jgi:hypothetical protein
LSSSKAGDAQHWGSDGFMQNLLTDRMVYRPNLMLPATFYV